MHWLAMLAEPFRGAHSPAGPIRTPASLFSAMGWSHEALWAQVVHLISADGPPPPRAAGLHRLHIRLLHCSSDRCTATKEKDIRTASTFLASFRHHVPIYRAHFRGRDLVARLRPYRYCVPRLERKQHPHKWHSVGHRPAYQARIARHQL
jgi:hypothetical protein